MRSLLILAVVSCSPDEAGKPAEGASSPDSATPIAATETSNAVAATESSNAVSVSSPFHEDFRTAYGSVLWTMMVLHWCDRRWARPREMSAAEARLKAIDEQAVKLGLRPQMDQAAQGNAQQMATMRLDVHCNGGFDQFHARADRALTDIERLMRTRQAS